MTAVTDLNSAPDMPDTAPAAALGRATWRDYLALTKPKVISLLLWTTITAMFMAARGWPGLWLLVVVSVAGYMSAGSAGVFNMIIDRDIDLKMARTAKRPTSSGLISTRNAAIFGAALQILSFVMLWVWGSPLAALMSLAGFVTYVVVYTRWLKRNTWHNIVLGGAAGCFPPLVGWAAVTGDLNLFAWFLFAIIFFWTPVHFWALALMIKEEYREVGIPMLPVVHGDRLTVAQMMGLPDVATLLARMEEQRTFVAAQFDAIFADKAEPPDSETTTLADDPENREAIASRLLELGYDDPPGAAARLVSTLQGPRDRRAASG